MGERVKTLRDLKELAPRFGSEAVKYVDIQIEYAPNGEDEEITANDSDVLFLMMELCEREKAMNGDVVL